MNTRDGFTLAELLIAGTLALLLMAGLFAAVDPGRSAAGAQSASIDIVQRLRAATESLEFDLRSAGSGPVNGAFGGPIGAVTPCVLPFRIGPRGDPAGVVRPDALTLVAALPGEAAMALSQPFDPGDGVARIELNAACPSGDESCGVDPGDAVLLLDGRAQSDLYRVVAVAGRSLVLEPRGAVSGRPHPAGSLVVRVTIGSFHLRPGPAGEGGQLVSGDGESPDVPLADHIAGFVVELFGDPQPPRIRPAGVPPRSATYGPQPPPVGVDDDRDTWPPGENCTFLVRDGEQESRMVALGPAPAVVPLGPAVLTDGPWCPDASSPNRYDADLLRVRQVRVTIRAEAASAAARGGDDRWFWNPGSARHWAAMSPDRQVVFDVVPRALHVGR